MSPIQQTFFLILWYPSFANPTDAQSVTFTFYVILYKKANIIKLATKYLIKHHQNLYFFPVWGTISINCKRVHVSFVAWPWRGKKTPAFQCKCISRSIFRSSVNNFPFSWLSIMFSPVCLLLSLASLSQSQSFYRTHAEG